MNITYNNVQGASNFITFTDVPNILKISDTSGGTYATFSLMFSGNLKSVTTSNNQWYITFLGETITSVNDYSNAVNKNFYVSTDPQSTAASVAKALRNCAVIAANFTIEHDGNEVEIKARSVGRMWTGMSNWYSTNIANTYLQTAANDGSANSSLVGAIISADIIADGRYITSLSKNFYGRECAFDMSPILTTVSKFGETVPYTFSLSYTKNGEYTYLGRINTNYATPGYMVNQGAKYLTLGNSTVIAQNHSRGDARGVDNNTILYVYDNQIPISFYQNSTGYVDIDVEYLNSAFEVIAGADAPYTISDNSNKLNDFYITLSSNLMKQAFYVDIIFRDVNKTVRYNIIKPLKAAEYSQRILWRNSYGGISFFDFTGQKTETRDVEVSTYQKNIFDYYTDGRNELEKIYDNDVKYEVTLKSHLIEHNGKYIFNDLAQSADVWTVRNGQTYSIIIDSVSVEEQDRNDIYVATVKYHYSQKPSLL